MPERNKELFLRIADAIEKYPERHDQADWMRLGYDREFDTVVLDGETYTCGTTQCIAGWAAVLDDQAENFVAGRLDNSISKGAACALGLTDDERRDLFIFTADFQDNYHWPSVLREIADGEDVRSAVENNYAGGGRVFGERYVTRERNNA